MIAWKRFCDLQKKDGNSNIYSLLRMNKPLLENNVVIISTINEMNYKELNEYKHHIQKFISKELNNYSITIEIRLSNEESKNKYVDSKDKLSILLKDYGNLKKLIEEFKLRI